MRLIDADKIDFGKVFIGTSDFTKDTREAAQNLIDSQPTAHDVDKVVEELKEEFKKYYGNQFDKAPYLVNSIKIVKSGGIE